MKLFSRRVAKSGANGLYVFRPVLNAQEWIDWATAAGVPNMLGVADLHVTIVSSATDAKIPLDTCPKVISTSGDYWGAGRFGFLGKTNQAFCFVFSSWELQDRNYTYSSNGTTSDFPTYVPHLSLSMDAAGFDLPDAALANVPDYIILGAETRADRKVVDPSDLLVDDDAGTDADGDDDPIFVVVMASAKSAAEEVLAAKSADVNPLEMTALLAVAHDKPITRTAARALAKATWAPDLLKTVMDKTDARGFKPPSQMEAAKANTKPYGDVTYADPGYVDGVHRYPVDTEQHIRAAWSYIHHAKDRAQYSNAQVEHIEAAIISAWKEKIDKAGPPAADQPAAPKKKTVVFDTERKSKEVVVSIAQVSGDVAKNLGSMAGAKGYDEERHWVYGIANVSTIGGELVEDLGGDSFTTGCLEEYCAMLITSQAGGDFEHETDARNTIVGALMFSADLQKSLGIDLGMEFLLTVTHVPDDADWELVKSGDWMQSIAGIFFYED